MTDCKPGTVVLVDFPFTDWTVLKKRPAVVLSSEKFNRTHPDVVVCAITSRILKQAGEEEYLLNPAEQRAAGLPKPSVVKLTKLLTLDQSLVWHKLGQLPPASTRRLLAQFRKNFRP